MGSSNSKINTAVLRTLHRLQRQKSDLRERLERGPRQIRVTETNVRHCEEQVEKVKEEAKAMRLEAEKKQSQLKMAEDKVKELEAKLNTATSNREYQILKEQIAADKMANSVSADEILEALEKIDQIKENITKAEEVVTGAKKKSDEVRAKVAEREPSLKADLARIEAELEKEEATLPEDIVELYRRIVAHRGEDALAVVEGQFCGGCHQQIPLNHCANVMLGKPVLCVGCGRLLYLPEGTDHPAKKEA